MIGDAARDSQFRREALALDLRWRCPHCVHEIPDDGSCSLGYPNGMMLTSDLRFRDEDGRWVFCKAFELDDA